MFFRYVRLYSEVDSGVRDQFDDVENQFVDYITVYPKDISVLRKLPKVSFLSLFLSIFLYNFLYNLHL